MLELLVIAIFLRVLWVAAKQPGPKPRGPQPPPGDESFHLHYFRRSTPYAARLGRKAANDD